MKKHSQWARTGFAISGVKEAWKREASFRTEVFLIAIMMGWMIWHHPAPFWWILVSMTSAALLSVELLNTAIEMVCDALHPDQHPLIKVAKDCASAAVLMISLLATAIAILTLWKS